MHSLRRLCGDVIALFFPVLCAACREQLSEGERVICLHCRFSLPYTAFHTDTQNPMAKQFWGRFTFRSAQALFYFKKGSRVQHLVHLLKYRGRTDIGELLGELYGKRLHDSPLYHPPDLIVPVPLHASRQRKRGYNQSEHFAIGLSRALNVPVGTGNLVRLKPSETQTHKNRFMRFSNMKDLFVVKNAAAFENAHLLLADDVVTTGATAEACCNELLKIRGTSVSIVSIAYAE